MGAILVSDRGADAGAEMTGGTDIGKAARAMFWGAVILALLVGIVAGALAGVAVWLLL